MTINIFKPLLAALVFAPAAVFAAQEAAPETANEPSGAAFAHTCAACHGTYGYSNSAFPGLAGMDRKTFVREMQRFRSKDCPSSIMSHIADGYNDAELERMAAFFAALPKKAPNAASSASADQSNRGGKP